MRLVSLLLPLVIGPKMVQRLLPLHPLLQRARSRKVTGRRNLLTYTSICTLDGYMYMHAYILMYAHIYFICIHTCTHMHTHTHTQTTHTNNTHTNTHTNKQTNKQTTNTHRECSKASTSDQKGLFGSTDGQGQTPAIDIRSMLSFPIYSYIRTYIYTLVYVCA